MSGQTSPADFEEFYPVGCDALAWIADYLRTIRTRSVLRLLRRGISWLSFRRAHQRMARGCRASMKISSTLWTSTQRTAITRGTSAILVPRPLLQRFLPTYLPPASTQTLCSGGLGLQQQRSKSASQNGFGSGWACPTRGAESPTRVVPLVRCMRWRQRVTESCRRLRNRAVPCALGPDVRFASRRHRKWVQS